MGSSGNLITTIVFCAFLSFVPILGWLYFFQSRNREKTRFVALAFIAGMFSVVPIKLYERYWDTAVFYFEHLNLFKHLSMLINLPDLPRLLSFITVNAIVALGLFVFIAFVMFAFETITGDNTARVFRQKTAKIFESPLFFISVGVICGLVAYFFSLALSQKVWFFIVVGMLEEYVKHLVLRFSDDEKINSVDDAISFAIIVALGFAFVENVLYFQKFWATGGGFQQFVLFLGLRSTISVIAHASFSGIFGYFYGIARFSTEIFKIESKATQHPIINFCHRVLHLKKETFFHEEKMMEGMLAAMIIHGIFNSMLEFGQISLLVPALGILFFIVLNLFHRVKIHRQTGAVSTS